MSPQSLRVACLPQHWSRSPRPGGETGRLRICASRLNMSQLGRVWNGFGSVGRPTSAITMCPCTGNILRPPGPPTPRITLPPQYSLPLLRTAPSIVRAESQAQQLCSCARTGPPLPPPSPECPASPDGVVVWVLWVTGCYEAYYETYSLEQTTTQMTQRLSSCGGKSEQVWPKNTRPLNAKQRSVFNIISCPATLVSLPMSLRSH